MRAVSHCVTFHIYWVEICEDCQWRHTALYLSIQQKQRSHIHTHTQTKEEKFKSNNLMLKQKLSRFHNNNNPRHWPTDLWYRAFLTVTGAIALTNLNNFHKTYEIKFCAKHLQIDYHVTMLSHRIFVRLFAQAPGRNWMTSKIIFFYVSV